MKNLVVKIGGFHKMMSLVGCKGHLTANTGLHEALESIYAKNSVDHITSGKAISRALRGHFIVDAVLTGLLLAQKKTF